MMRRVACMVLLFSIWLFSFTAYGDDGANFDETIFPPSFDYLIDYERIDWEKVEVLSYYIAKVNRKLTPKQVVAIAIALVYTSELYDIDLADLTALVQVESTFNPNAKSKVGARGLAQVILKYHKDVIPFDDPEILHDPLLGIMAGAEVLIKYGYGKKPIAKVLAKYYGMHSHDYIKKFFKYRKGIKYWLKGGEYYDP